MHSWESPIKKISSISKSKGGYMSSKFLFNKISGVTAKNILLVIGVFILSNFFTACKKETMPITNENNFSSARSQQQIATESILVSNGSSIQAAVNAATPNSI